MVDRSLSSFHFSPTILLQRCSITRIYASIVVPVIRLSLFSSSNRFSVCRCLFFFFFFLIYSFFTMRVHVARLRKYVLKLANGVYIILTLFFSFFSFFFFSFSSCFSCFPLFSIYRLFVLSSLI